MLILSRSTISQSMASDQPPPPPDYRGDEDESKNDESMYASTLPTGGANIPLDDDDDDDDKNENPFGLTTNQSITPSSPKPSFEFSRNDPNDDKKDKDDTDEDDDPFGVKKPTDRSSVPTTP